MTAVSNYEVQYDVVKFDGRLKEVIRLEKLTRKQWEQKWGFTADLMKMYREDANAKGINIDKKPSRSWAISKCDMKVLPSPPVPKTSSALVGWRSSQLKYSLERVGPLYISPLQTIDPPGRRPSQQINICIC